MRLCFLSLLLLLCFNSFAQNKGIVEGTVSSKGKTIEGVTVILENEKHKTGAYTDENGEFKLKAPKGNYVLKFSFVGYSPKTLKVRVEAQKTIRKNTELSEDVLGISEVVVTGTRTALNRKESPVLVSVTGEQQLASVKAVTLMDGLVFQPGLRPEVNCQNCNYSQIRINGLEGAYSQILINSRPIFGSLNGVYGLEQIPTNMIKQIEVIRGGGSALFGSNAIAGTINVITKNPTRNEAQAGVIYSLIDGDAQDIVSSFNGAIVTDDYNRGLSFYGLHRQRDPYDANDDGLSELTKLRNINAGAKFFSDFSSRKKLVGELNVSKENRRGGNKFDLPEHNADIAESIRTDVVGGNMTYDYYTSSFNHKFSLFGSGQNTKAHNYYGGGGDLGAYGVTKETTWLAGGQHTAQLPVGQGKIELTSGVEYKYDKLSEKRLNPNVQPVNQEQNVIGVYTQADWRISKSFKFLAGVRLDNISSDLLNKSITAINPRASFLYNITDVLMLRGSYARGFRAPLLYSEDVHNELIGLETRIVRLADDLKEETSNTLSGSFEYNHSHEGHQMVFMLEGFYTKLKDRFSYVQVENQSNDSGFYVKEKRNIEGATVAGANVEFKYSPSSKFLMQLGATVQTAKLEKKEAILEDKDGKVLIESDKILRTPDIYGNLTATYYPTQDWKINLTGVYTGAMDIYHESVEKLKRSKGMFEFGLNTSYTIYTKDFFTTELSIGVKNMFNQYQDDFDKGVDRDPTYIYGPALPRTFLTGIKIKL